MLKRIKTRLCILLCHFNLFKAHMTQITQQQCRAVIMSTRVQYTRVENFTLLSPIGSSTASFAPLESKSTVTQFFRLKVVWNKDLQAQGRRKKWINEITFEPSLSLEILDSAFLFFYMWSMLLVVLLYYEKRCWTHSKFKFLFLFHLITTWTCHCDTDRGLKENPVIKMYDARMSYPIVACFPIWKSMNWYKIS